MEWRLANAFKCVHLKITNKRLTTDSTYFMKHHQIHHTNNVTYLGLSFDEHLNCTNHVQRNVCKANCANTYLWRNISFCPLRIKNMCYLAMVRPILEYASTVWCPYTSCDIHKLEMVQCRVARFMTNSYSPWVSVSEILIYQLLKNVVEISYDTVVYKWSTAKSKLKVGIVLFELQAALGDIAEDFATMLQNWCSFTFLLSFNI